MVFFRWLIRVIASRSSSDSPPFESDSKNETPATTEATAESTPAAEEPKAEEVATIAAGTEVEPGMIAVSADESQASVDGPTATTEVEPEADEIDRVAVEEYEDSLLDAKELVCHLCLQEENLKEHLSDVKKRRDEAVSNLASIKRNNPTDYPGLFTKSKRRNTEANNGESSDSTQPKATSITNSGDGEAWKNVPVDTLGLPAGIVAALAEADIDTLGKIADYSASGRRLTDIANIGTAKAEKIEAACEAYWKRNPN